MDTGVELQLSEDDEIGTILTMTESPPSNCVATKVVNLDLDELVYRYVDDEMKAYSSNMGSVAMTPPSDDDVIEVSCSNFDMKADNDEDQSRLEPLFHWNHGKMIKISPSGDAAQRIDYGTRDGIVMSQYRMLPNCVYEVSIDEVNRQRNAVKLGIVTREPASYDLPHSFHTRDTVDPSVVSLSPYSAWVSGKQTILKNGRVLYKVPVGSRVGVLVTSERVLRLHVNGHWVDTQVARVPDPCYFMFDLCGYVDRVTFLPVRRVGPTPRDLIEMDHDYANVVCPAPSPARNTGRGHTLSSRCVRLPDGRQ